jgi:protocatechuate 3,4-dioxygenase beta subunit
VSDAFLGRRSLLVAGLAAVAGCTERSGRGAGIGSGASSGAKVRNDAPLHLDPHQAAPPAVSAAPRVCRLTEANELGPYYRPGVSDRTDLLGRDIPGEQLALVGRVLAAGCCSALAGAAIELWQADGNGRYDNDGTFPAGTTRLRGRATAGADGSYAFRTVVPGHYLDGGKFRPAHIHVKVTPLTGRPLVTQLYFPGDPHNEGDRFFLPSLIVDLDRGARALTASYDFVLAG